MTREQIDNIAAEATKLLKENPDWTYKKAIATAKTILGVIK